MCCGNISHARDILTSCLRDGRWIKGRDLWEFVETLKNHDGFEYMLPIDNDKHEEYKSWRGENPDKDPIYRLWQVYDKIKGHLYTSRPFLGAPPQDAPIRQPIQLALSILNLTITQLWWSTSALSRPLKNEPAWMKDQKDAQRQLTIARMMPALRDVMEHIDELDLGDFEGFAICEQEEPDMLIKNNLGLCIYRTKEEAQKMIDTWAIQDDNCVEDTYKKEVRKKTVIRPVSVSSKEGLYFFG